MSCHITDIEINGWSAVRLSNSLVEVTVLPGKGADIYSFVDLGSGIDILMKTPWGLQPPGSQPRIGSGSDKFLHNYEGAWQELFPNTGPSCAYNGREMPLHGEVATLAWSSAVERNCESEVRICLKVRCRQVPLALTRRMSLSRGSPVLAIDESVQNLSGDQVFFVWGHHPVLGSPFLESGCRMHVEKCVACTPEIPFDAANASYASAQRAPWPYIRTIDGADVDLRLIPGPEVNTHDHACLTDLARGWAAVENPRLGLTFSLEWDSKLFRWINNWRPFGGSHAPALEGLYGLALEPWATRSNLAAALAGGEALSVEPHGSIQTSFEAALHNT